ncbi:hypothetical protein ADEAN_000345100 [Angomonas deanei]|uniref:Uncharacterized protein n=1 Tax=Angomonas deanei TaxID=59799 RepID=A0A7G2CB83_9TRYP|nr:hypothetical protein ADEAN_000345100 [Angomonas deanei]
MTSLLEEEPFTDQHHRQRQQMWWLLSSEYSAEDQDTIFRQILKRYTPLTATHLPAITGLSHCEGGRLQLQGVLHRLLEHCCPHTSVTTGNTPPEMAIQETREHVAILLLSKDENENKRTFLRFVQRVSKKKNPQHFQSVKLMLVELTTDVDRLHATESCLQGLKDGHFFKLPKKGDTPTEGGRGLQTLSAGVVDVDPLSAAFLSYVTVTLAV